MIGTFFEYRQPYHQSFVSKMSAKISLEGLEQRIKSLKQVTFSNIEYEFECASNQTVCDFAEKIVIANESDKFLMIACAFRIRDITLLDRFDLVQLAAQIKPARALNLFADYNRLDEVKVTAQRAASRVIGDSITHQKLDRLNKFESAFGINIVSVANVSELTFLAENRPDLLKREIFVNCYDPDLLSMLYERGVMENANFKFVNPTQIFQWFLDNPKAIVMETVLPLARRIICRWGEEKTTCNDQIVKEILNLQLLSPQEVEDAINGHI
jgi:hypothetical protein